MIPLLSLGLPGNASTAVMLGALLLYGLQPGPLLFTSHPEIVWPVIASLYLGNFMLLVLNLPLIPLWVRILRIPQWILYSTILVLAVVGAYSIRDSIFDVWMLILFSALGYAIRKVKIPAAPLLMAFVLGSEFESNLRLSMILSRNNPLIFIERPISGSILALVVVIFGGTTVVRMRRRRAPRDIEGPEPQSETQPQSDPASSADEARAENAAGEAAERK